MEFQLLNPQDKICLLFQVHPEISSFHLTDNNPDTVDDYSGFQGEVTSYTWLPTEIILTNILTWEKKFPESLVDVLVNNQPMYNFCQPLWIYVRSTNY